MESTKVVVDQNQIILLVLSQLRQWKYFSSMVALEEESGITVSEYSQDLLYLRRLILDGKFDEAIALVKPLNMVAGFDYNLFKFHCLKEKFLELLNSWSTCDSHSANILVKCLKELKSYSPTKEEYNKLCWLLTLEDIRSSQEYQIWTVVGGRLECFYLILPLVENYLTPRVELKQYVKKPQLSYPLLSNNRLVQLVSKGHLYELCHQVQNGNEKSETYIDNRNLDVIVGDCNLNAFDYIKQLPPCSFYSNARELQVTVIKKGMFRQGNQSQQKKGLLNKIRQAGSVPANLNHCGVGNVFSSCKSRKRSYSLEKFHNWKALSQKDSSTQVGALISNEHASGIHKKESKSRDEQKQQETQRLADNDEGTQLNRLHSVTTDVEKHSATEKSANDSVRNDMHYGHDEIIDRNEALGDSEIVESQEYSPPRLNFANIATLKDSQAVRTVAFHPHGEAFVVGSNSRALRICSSELLHSTYEYDPNMTVPEPKVLFCRERYHRGSIYCANWNCSGELLATGSNDKSVKLLRFQGNDFTNIDTMHDFNYHNGTVRDITFDNEQPSLLISGGGGDCAINVIDCANKQLVTSLRAHSAHVLALYSWSNQKLVSGSTDGNVCLWDIRNGERVRTLKLADSPIKQGITSVCVCNQNHLLAVGREDGACILYDIKADRLVHTFHPHNEDCRSLRFSPDSKYLLSASYDGTLILTDLHGYENSYPSFVVGQHMDKALKVSWHPEHYAFVSSSADGQASLWKLVTM